MISLPLLSRLPRTATLVAAGWLALAVGSTEALAQSRPAPPVNRPTATTPAPAVKPATKVQLQVLVVHATDSYEGVDPRIKALTSSFRYFKYKGYKLLSTQDAQVAINETANFPIAGGRKVKVTLLSMDEARAKLRMEINNNEGKLFDTTVNINRDGTFIITGPRYEDGILMLPVRASY